MADINKTPFPAAQLAPRKSLYLFSTEASNTHTFQQLPLCRRVLECAPSGLVRRLIGSACWTDTFFRFSCATMDSEHDVRCLSSRTWPHSTQQESRRSYASRFCRNQKPDTNSFDLNGDPIMALLRDTYAFFLETEECRNPVEMVLTSGLVKLE